MSVFNGETHTLQTWKYNVIVMSLVAKKYLTFLPVTFLLVSS